MSSIADKGVQAGSVSPEEASVRRDLAAIYRLVASHGWDDMIFTHISARVPGNDDRFLINPLQLTFDEITASNLMTVDLAGNIVGGRSDWTINHAGFAIHSALHDARPDAHFIIHLHTLDGMAVSCQAEGLLPLTQTSLTVIPQLAYHHYEGIADLDERARLVADLGDKRLYMLRNHGTLALGGTAAEAWLFMYMFERACALQTRALAAGRDQLVLASQAAQEAVARHIVKNKGSEVFDIAWAAMLRRVEREAPDFAD